MNVLGLIPARGGSKRVPRKNLALCAGKTLLAWTAEAALQAKLLGRVMLSTDDEEIAAEGRRLGLEVPFLRPEALANDAATMLPVIKHALEHAGEPIDAVVLLQPTSPLRLPDDIDASIELLSASSAESVVSVVRVPHQFHPWKVVHETSTGLRPFVSGAPEQGHTPGELPSVFGRNGPAILATRTSVIEQGELYGHPCLPYVMPQDRSIDVDEPLDLAIAEFLLNRRREASA